MGNAYVDKNVPINAPKIHSRGYSCGVIVAGSMNSIRNGGVIASNLKRMPTGQLVLCRHLGRYREPKKNCGGRWLRYAHSMPALRPDDRPRMTSRHHFLVEHAIWGIRYVFGNSQH
ncbi:hypothetical protein PILCRDRAFT_822886 [Piloderma croceum F 1598]|uniref:Uncharacterized protein n=1 Tax=Piloderma croceum (strain F 1598) TaxID=765440 RepID=A0A0C3BRT3_PILCF|nr:hypothetical protein PILCRDRAFT_822886 [Piloderma croceum F 1598]